MNSNQYYIFFLISTFFLSSSCTNNSLNTSQEETKQEVQEETKQETKQEIQEETQTIELSPTPHPIDSMLTSCLATFAADGGTSKMVSCYIKSYENWDKELNKIYQDLLPILEEDAQEALRGTQRAWIKHQQKEIAFIDKFYAHENFSGSMWNTSIIGHKVSLIKARTMELEYYHHLMTKGYYEGIFDEE